MTKWGTSAHCHFILATSKLDTAPPLWLRDENPRRDLLSIVRKHPLIVIWDLGDRAGYRHSGEKHTGLTNKIYILTEEIRGLTPILKHIFWKPCS